MAAHVRREGSDNTALLKRGSSSGHVIRRERTDPTGLVMHELAVNMSVRRDPTSADVLKRAESALFMGQADIRFAEKLAGDEEKSKEEKFDHAVQLERDPTLAADFKFNEDGLSSEEAERLLKEYGLNELPEKTIPKWYIFLSQYWQPMPLMIWAAAIIEAAIGNYIDMGILLVIQFANGSIAFYETVKAGDAVAALKASLKPSATVRRDGKWETINATLVVPGDLVLLATGAAIPADCRLNKGEIDVDQAALTGESLPVPMFKGDSVKMGSTVVRGETEGTVEFTGANTFFGKTAALLGDTNEASNFHKLLVRIMIVLVVLSLTLCIINFVYLVSFPENTVKDALSYTVVVLVASIPLAIEIVTTTTLAVGSKDLSKHGAIVSRLAAIEDLAGMGVLCSDKTGTLTLNKMVIQEETPVYSPGENQYSLLRYAAMAAKWKEPPKDALDTLTLNAVDMASLDHMEQLDYMPFDPVVKRTEGTVRDTKTGEVFKTTKGAPHVLLKLVGHENHEVVDAVEEDVKTLGSKGIRSLAVARTDPNNSERWIMLGLLTFLDPPRPDTKQTIHEARAYGVMVKMITGDHLLIAKNMAGMLELGENIENADALPLLDPETKQKPKDLGANYGDFILRADGFAQVFPEHKYLIVECLRELGYKTGMTGDGVNDAPALKRADVGIAVQGATDAARAAADIILTEPGLSTIIHGIITARCVFVRIRNFITYRVAATLQLLFFFFIATFAFHPDHYTPAPGQTWPAFFHMPVLMLMLITVLNDGTLIAIGYDRVTPPKTPTAWNLRAIFTISSVLAGVACASSLFLLWCLLDSWSPNGVMQGLNIGGIDYGQVTTSIYLKVAVSDFLTLFSSRTGGDWFWSTRPATLLLGAGALAISCSLAIALAWPATDPDGIPAIGLARATPYTLFLWILGYCLVWWLIQDAAKVGAYALMSKYNIFKINETGQVKLAEKTDNAHLENLVIEDEHHNSVPVDAS
jgi:H+-transporting ATPase